MDAFGDTFFKEEQEVDPAAEFLAREQDQLAGLEDEIQPVALSTQAAAPPNEGFDRYRVEEFISKDEHFFSIMNIFNFIFFR